MRFVPSTRELCPSPVVSSTSTTSPAFKDSFDTVARFNLSRRGRGDKILAPRRWMQIEDGTGGTQRKTAIVAGRGSGEKIVWPPPNLSSISSKVGFLVAAGMEPGDFHSALLIEVKFYIPSPRL
jgi:hypothetical protein